MASSSRSNPKDKFRSEEDRMDELLKAAGMYEEGMTFDMKKSYVKVLDESRTVAQNQSFHQEVLNADTQEHAVSQGSGSPAAKVARIATDEKEIDENQVLEFDVRQDTAKRSSPADMFDFIESNDVEVIDTITSPFQDTHDEPVSDNEKEANTSTSGLLAKSDSENVVVKDRTNRKSEHASNEVIRAELFENEDSSESFKSTKDVMVSNSPVYEPETTKIHLSKFHMPTYSYARTQEYKDILRANIFGYRHNTQEEPQPFYETVLSERPKMKHRRCPFYFDGSIDKNKQRAVIRSELKNNSLLLQQLRYEQIYPDFSKWANPIRSSSLDKLDSMDKCTSGEPKEFTLPWGQKPFVLDWKKEKDEATKKNLANPSRSQILSLSRAQKMLEASGVSIEYSRASTSRNFEPERHSVRPVKPTLVIDASSDEEKAANKSDDEEWTDAPVKCKGKGVRGRGSGNSTGRGGKTNEVNRGARGNRGRGGKGARGRGAPPVASVQPHLLRRNQKDKTEDMQEAIQHPAVDFEAAGIQCPICTSYFAKDQIEDHAATCDNQSTIEVETEAENSCPRCSTLVPTSAMEKHNPKCEQKHQTARKLDHPSTSGQTKDSTDVASVSQIIHDWSEDEVDEAIIPQPPKRRRTDNTVENES